MANNLNKTYISKGKQWCPGASSMPVLGKFKSKNSRYSASLQDYLSKLKHKTYLQPCLNPGPRPKGRSTPPPDLAPGLLLLLRNQLCFLDEGAGAVLPGAAALGPRFFDGLAKS
jgi:hypothetical protein